MDPALVGLAIGVMTCKPTRPGWMARWAYRVRQTWFALTARPSAGDLAAARGILGPRLWRLFQQQSRADQAHALAVWRAVRAAGGDNVVQQAALLHDVGKSRVPLRLWHRVLAVLGRACCPRWARGPWAQGPPRGWRAAFVVAEHHAAWGAAMAQAVGAAAEVVELIAHHHDPVPDALPPRLHRAWALLRMADEEAG